MEFKEEGVEEAAVVVVVVEGVEEVVEDVEVVEGVEEAASSPILSIYSLGGS
jgi:hypothetical protein